MPRRFFFVPSLFPVTSPRGEDRPRQRRYGRLYDSFQSPPREGRIIYLLSKMHKKSVSSHLPARGGSDDFLEMQVDMDVSSHLPARGGSSICRLLLSAALFPVTSPRGEDPEPAYCTKHHRRFPVTSPRGEDRGYHRRDSKPRMFPVTSPRGEDPQATPQSTASWKFPVTSPRGEDRRLELIPAQPTWFPVTSPREEDHGVLGIGHVCHVVSSHLPARGGSAKAWMRHNSKDVSSHLPARGGSFGCAFNDGTKKCFQSPPREGRISKN